MYCIVIIILDVITYKLIFNKFKVVNKNLQIVYNTNIYK